MTFVELFAGIGGFRLGLENSNLRSAQLADSKRPTKHNIFENKFLKRKRLDYTCVWSNEIDKYASQIYRKNFGEGELYEGDIRQVNTDDIPDHDLLTGGFPCQAFSIAGKRRGFDDTRGTLFFEIARICRAKKPRYILLENVKGLLSHESGQTFQTILKVLSNIGYVLQWEVLNSKNFGVPQSRDRVFIVGHLGEKCRPKVFPIGESQTIPDSQDKREQRKGQRISSTIDSRYGALRNAGETYLIHNVYGGFKEDKPREFHNISPTIRTPKGGGHLPMVAQCIRAEHHNTADVHYIPKGTKIRRLTPTECERLQGFPDGWTEGVSDTQRYKCLGNAVTVNVIQKIGEQLIKCI